MIRPLLLIQQQIPFKHLNCLLFQLLKPLWDATTRRLLLFELQLRVEWLSDKRDNLWRDNNLTLFPLTHSYYRHVETRGWCWATIYFGKPHLFKVTFRKMNFKHMDFPLFVGQKRKKKEEKYRNLKNKYLDLVYVIWK